MYVKVYMRMKYMNLKYCMVFIWESLSAWKPEADDVSQFRDNKQLLPVPWMMVILYDDRNNMRNEKSKILSDVWNVMRTSITYNKYEQ